MIPEAHRDESRDGRIRFGRWGKQGQFWTLPQKNTGGNKKEEDFSPIEANTTDSS